MKKLIKIILQFLFEILTPLTLISVLWLKILKKIGAGSIGNTIFMRLGLWPIEDHYYQPLMNPKKHLTLSFAKNIFSSNGLNYLLNKCVNLTTTNNYTLDLRMNEPPTGQGIIDKQAIINAGNSVYTD